MLSEIFQTLPLPADRLIGTYDIRLVALSYLVAVLASYIALDMVGRLRDQNNTRNGMILWFVGGSVAMGAGIWSMHFIGMLSFTIPGITLQYNIYWTGFSLLVAIFASAFALYLLKSSLLNVLHLVGGGILLGLAIASMHYTGMEAMLISLNIKYLPGLFFVSILVAIIASEAAIWLALKSTTIIMRLRNRMKLVSAIIMGLAICGMHYTGMAASIFTPLCFPSSTNVSAAETMNPTILSMSIAGVTFVVLSITFLASTYKEAMNQQQFEQARQLGMAELAASVLHNVGNVLNTVNVSAHTLSDHIASSRLAELEKLCALLNENKDNLASFLATDPRGMKVLDFLNRLNEYRKEENQSYNNEIANIIKNTILIKEIISTQQAMSKTTGFDTIISVNELLDEALLVTGYHNDKVIHLVKNYDHIPAIHLDKVKLLQVFVNIFRNAKESLKESNNTNKTVTVETNLIKKEKKIIIKISDNGSGISIKNINKIFVHGFTTKKTGHGFGLHASALAINELGGKIEVKSEGLEKGATFIIELPYKLPQ